MDAPTAAVAMSPPRFAVEDVERLVTSLRFECEDEGLWPGAATLPRLHPLTNVVGLLWDLRETLEWFAPVARTQPAALPIEVVGWGSDWTIELSRTLWGLRAAAARLAEHWPPPAGPGFGESSWCIEDDPDGWGHLPGGVMYRGADAEPLKPIPGGLAAVLSRCAERLRRVLAAVPERHESYTPTEKESRVLAELDGVALSLDELERRLKRNRTSLCKFEMASLKDRGLVKVSRSMGGYYRPDSPPVRPNSPNRSKK